MITIWPILKFEQDYDLLNKLGEGKFGEVFQVEHRKTYDICAAKIMKCSKASEKLKVRNEIDLLAKFDHENILRLIEVHEDSDHFIQVLEHLSGGQLFDRIVNHVLDFTEDDIRDIVKQICAGCRYLDSLQVVHLDIKPENIMCVRPNSFQIKIVDFGFARQLHHEVDTRVTEGTPEFVSPEVLQYEPVKCTTDMWSVGVLTYVLLSGLSPFCGADNEETFHNILMLSYRFDEQEFCQVSDQARDFIRALLVLDPLTRMSASQAQLHSWLIHSATRRTFVEGEKALLESVPFEEATSTVSRKPSYDRRRLEGFSTARMRWQKCTNMILKRHRM